MAQPTRPPWIQELQQRDPKFVESYMSQREHILKDGAIPGKYKILMTMIVDALLSHPDGVATIANRARAAGASRRRSRSRTCSAARPPWSPRSTLSARHSSVAPGPRRSRVRPARSRLPSRAPAHRGKRRLEHHGLVARSIVNTDWYALTYLSSHTSCMRPQL